MRFFLTVLKRTRLCLLTVARIDIVCQGRSDNNDVVSPKFWRCNSGRCYSGLFGALLFGVVLFGAVLFGPLLFGTRRIPRPSLIWLRTVCATDTSLLFRVIGFSTYISVVNSNRRVRAKDFPLNDTVLFDLGQPLPS